jgi:signal transduction histidine kinase
MNNIEKHAEAAHVEIQMTSDEDHAHLSIKDDGHGFNPVSVSESGMGLSIMQERANAIGARIEIQDTPGEGSKVDVRWERDG